MTKEVPIISVSQFKWQGTHGHATVDKLGHMPTRFFCNSSKTNSLKYFNIDTEDAGYEDQWDGVMRKFVDDERKLFITVHYEEPWI